MKIGIDARVLGTSRALDRYTRNLITNLAAIKSQHRFVIFISEKFSFESLGIPKALNFEYVPLPPSPALFDHFLFGLRVKKYGLKVLFHPDNKSFLWCKIPQVTTLHDLTPQKFPGLVLSKSSWLFLRQKIYFALQSAALKNSAAVITVSKNTKKDAMLMLKLKDELIYPIYEGVERHFSPVNAGKVKSVLDRYNIKKPYLFYVGGFGRHKNALSVARAFATLEKSFKDLNLVLGGSANDAGSSGQNIYGELLQFVGKNRLAQRVFFPGFIAEEDLPAFYSGAYVFIFPSKYEGFGFPPLEAMACGVPVVCSQAASLPEVGGKAVLYAQSVDEITFAVKQILESGALKKELAQKGLKQAKKFSWPKCARETLKVLESL